MGINRRRISLSFLLIFVLVMQALSTALNNQPYTLPDLGNLSLYLFGPNDGAAPDPTQVTLGYALIKPPFGLAFSAVPSGFEILRYRANGAWVSFATMPLSAPVLSGRTYAEMNGPVTTGMAIVNPGTAPLTVTFYFTNNANGADFGQGVFTLGAGEEKLAFFNAAPFNISNAFTGTFTFSASAAVGAASIRGYTNERNEFLWSAQTVAPITQQSSGPIVIPQFADGGRWTTSVELVNTSDQSMSGTVQFYDEGRGTASATPLTIVANGQSASSFSYRIAPHASATFDTSGGTSTIQVGSVVVMPDGGTNSPAGQAVFSLFSNGATVTQAGVAAQPSSTAVRLYVENNNTQFGVPSSSGIAIVNRSTTVATVTAELFDSNGVTTGLTTTLSLPPLGHTARFLHELFPGVTSLSTPLFHALVRFTSTAPLAVTGLIALYNERSEFLITASPATDENAVVSPPPLLVFPDLAFLGGTPVPAGSPVNGFSTELVLFNSTPGQVQSGRMWVYTPAGLPLNVFSFGP